MKFSFYISIVLILLNHLATSCQNKVTTTNLGRNISSEFKKYWYNGTAEISTYTLSQNRYGELRNGHASLIYVTENFLKKEQVKADNAKKDNIPILKLNSIKKFNTGVYPYSIMQSVFSPVNTSSFPLKASASIQEWCGQTFIQLNNKAQFEIQSYSYFASEGDLKINLDKQFTENELWNLIRLGGISELPTGNFKIIPALEFIRLKHVPIKSYKATAVLKKGNLNSYILTIPDLKRTLKINFQPKFPFIIESWSETIENEPTTTATRITTKNLAYWGLNRKKDETFRKELGLE